MRGVITGKDVLGNFPTIWKGFGARCALRCLGAILTARPTTFLELVFPKQSARGRWWGR